MCRRLTLCFPTALAIIGDGQRPYAPSRGLSQGLEYGNHPPVRQGSEAALFFGRPETVADKIIRLHGLMQVDRFELHVSSIMQGRCARWSCTALRSLRWSVRSWALDRRSEALTGCDCS